MAGPECPEITIPSREPTPDEVATFVDLLERLLESAGPRDQAVIEGLMSGQSVKELASQLNTTERTIYRNTALLRQTLLRMTESERVA